MKYHVSQARLNRLRNEIYAFLDTYHWDYIRAMLTEAQREVVPKSSFSEETMNKAHELVLKAITDAADGYERLFRVCKNCHQEYQLGEFEENNYMCYYDDCFSEHGEEEDNLIIDEFGIDWG